MDLTVRSLSIALRGLRVHARCEHHDSANGPIPFDLGFTLLHTPRCTHPARSLAVTGEPYYRLLCDDHAATSSFPIVVALSSPQAAPHHGATGQPPHADLVRRFLVPVREARPSQPNRCARNR